LSIVLSMFFVMWILGVEFNPASVIHLNMIVILGADFTTHITNAFITNPGTYAQRLEATFKYGG